MRNRLLYHTLMRLGQGLLFLAGCAAGAAALIAMVELSSRYLGSPIPAIAASAVLAMVWMSYAMAKHDVQTEKRMQERTLENLRKD